jgi:bifunctional UDP-N-acetylglucosamine pyrophosphorylase/glucosamine-1-phosphate N-acetyltransferase
MLDHLLALHASTTGGAIVIVAPDALEQFVGFKSRHQSMIELVVQEQPTGMLDAILVARDAVSKVGPRRVSVTWCDQIAVADATVRRLASHSGAANAADLVFPTLVVGRPYIHFDRDHERRIVGVRQRREGDHMPERGETDMGLFDLSLDAYVRALPAFSESAPAGAGTGERNFLPFIPWLAARRTVETISGTALVETIGINTPEELSAIEAYLERPSRPA